MIEQSTQTDALEPFEAESWEECVSQALVIIERINRDLWELAAVCASVPRRYGEEAIPKFAGEIGYSASRVYQLIETWEAWKDYERSEILSFHHHTIAARHPEPEEAIQKATDEEWSTRELEEYIEEEWSMRELEEYGPAVKAETMVCPRCDGTGEVPAD